VGDHTAPTWWQTIEEHIAEREGDAPDPWADRDVAGGGTALTDGQTAFLEGLSDQPSPPRLSLRGDVETGNSPGDVDNGPGVPSS
jgi:hypothetical protein